MKASPFSYHRPETIPAALELLGSMENARVIAGGQSLMAMMNMRYVQVDHLVDLNRIDELVTIQRDGDVLEIGAMVRQYRLLESAEVRRHSPLITEALKNVGHIQTRARGTIGGSLCHLDPAAELPAALLALDATLVLEGPGGTREVPIEDWFLGYMTPNHEPSEILTKIRVSRSTTQFASTFLEVARRKGDFALAAVACVLRLRENLIENPVIVVAGLATRPERLFAAEEVLSRVAPTDEVVARAAAAVDALGVIADSYSDPGYKKGLARTLVKRVVGETIEKCKGGAGV